MSENSAPPFHAPLLMTVDQVAEALGGLSRGTIFTLLREGEIRSCRVGRRRLVRPEDLAAYVNRQAGVAPPGAA
jgi:excisionase family DNA binding protein